MLSRIRSAATHAREQGTLQSLETLTLTLPTSPPFLLRILSNITRKKAASNLPRDPTASAPRPVFNPFLPYEPSMHVQDVPPDHVLLLNKFNVVNDHTLLVTSRFEEQSSLLTKSDFVALMGCLKQLGGVAFYNAGRVAGASQRHKHLQLVPALGDGRICMFDEVFKGVGEEGVGEAEMGFVNAIVGMRDVSDMVERGEVERAGVVCMQKYVAMLRIAGERVEALRGGSGETEAEGLTDGASGEGVGERQPFAYNLLATTEWMMVVPRRRECYEGISVNSLGFVGCLLVRDDAQADMVRRVGGMGVLREVAFATCAAGGSGV